MNDAHFVLGVLNGDDIGHEIAPAAVAVASAAAGMYGLRIDWRPMPAGRTALDGHGSAPPEGTLQTPAKMNGFVLGPIGHRDYPKGRGAINPRPIMRRQFNLFANSYAMIGLTRMLLDWLGRRPGVPQAVNAAQAMGKAIVAALADPVARTADVRGAGKASAMTAAVIKALR